MKIEDVPTNQIKVSVFNVRKSLDGAGIESLAQSIAESGLLQPIVVSKRKNDKYDLIAGQRRFIACSKNLNWEKIPAIIIENAKDKEILTMSTVENLQRADLNLIYKSDAFIKLYEMYDNDINKVINATGYTEQTIKKYFLLKYLQEQVRKEIIEEKRKVSLNSLITLIKNENIPQIEHQKFLNLAGGKTTKAIIEKLKEITDSSTKQHIFDSLKGEKCVRDIVMTFLSHKSDQMKKVFRELIIRDYQEYKKKHSDLKERILSLQNKFPLLKIIEIENIFEDFSNKLNILLEFDKKYLFELIKFNRYNFQSKKVLIYLLEDLKLNFKNYGYKFKNKINLTLETMKSLHIYEEIISEFTKVLNQSR
ncbi:hypothetical protein LCGC14_0864450 [marine sediment metagenome]|uniref:ParB-like N-terminal domain-containing protein n=1 Tax=marine sediment metagenome TaxID=412755 RepID=A0A0F9PBG4_9ZZZZ